MAMNRFAHATASTVEEALHVLGKDCRPLAGGVDLVDRMKEGLIAPSRIVSLKGISGLDQIHEDASGLHIGALTPLYRLMDEPSISSRPERACLHEALVETATPQIRHMATIGGNLLQRPRCWYYRNKLTHCLRKGGERCFAFRGENKRHAILGGGPCYIVHPSDSAVALLALDASVVVAGPADTRTVPLGDFYLLPRQDAHNEVALADNAILTAVFIPTPALDSNNSLHRGVYLKVPERGHRDFALVSVALQLALNNDGIVEHARVALGGVAPTPWRATATEKILVGQPLRNTGHPSTELIGEASRAATEGARPLEQNAYKVSLVQGLLKQALLHVCKDL
jgi:xanthine dehydrogenase YagS FAD-binding subunit